MVNLVVLCGLQGSGKSTYAKVSETLHGYKIVSSDEVRKEFPDAKNDTVFKIVYKRANELLERGESVVLDATNITIKSRGQIFQNIKATCFKMCIVFNTPYTICVERVKARNEKGDDHFVPLEVLERYYKSFEVPFYEEGWDTICFKNFDIGHKKSYVADMIKLLDKTNGFNQQNKHHTQDLGTHMLATATRLEKLNPDLDDAVRLGARLHDVGKLFTQSFGEDGQAHYYSHANVGAYEILSCVNTSVDASYWLDVAFYVNYHMHMYNLNTEKSIKKWKHIFGKEKFALLEKVHEADMNSHAKGEEKW